MLFRGAQWCCRFQVATLSRLVREKVRPARPDGGREREKVRPACSKWPKMGVLWRAGRSFSRLRLMECCAGRTFSRKCRWKPRAGRVFSRVNAKGPFVGRSFSWSCCGTGMSGELCRGPAAVGVPLGDFCCLDGGCVPPLDLGRATDTRSRVYLPSWLPVGASGRRPAIAFPRDFSHFAENATHPYI